MTRQGDMWRGVEKKLAAKDAEIDTLTARVKELEALVESAYLEGWTNGAGGMCSSGWASYEISEARAALKQEGE